MTKKYTDVYKMNIVEVLAHIKEKGSITIDSTEIKNVRQLCEFFEISTNTLYRWRKEFPALKTEKKDVSDEKVIPLIPIDIEPVENIENQIIPLRVECYAEDWCKAYQSDYDEGYGNCNMLGDCNGFRDLNDENQIEFHFKEKTSDELSNEVYANVRYKLEMSDINYDESIALARKDGVDLHESESEKTIRDGKYKQFKPDIAKEAYGERVEKNLIDLFNLPVIDENLAKSTGEISQIKKDAIKEFATNQRSMSTLAQALQISNYSNMKVAQMRLAIGNELIKLSGLIDMNKAKRKLKVNGEK